MRMQISALFFNLDYGANIYLISKGRHIGWLPNRT